MSTTDVIRKREIVLIQLAKAFFAKRDGMTDDDYRAVMLQLTGQSSSAKLDAAGRDKLLQHFKAKGFVVIAKTGAASRERGFIREPQVKKLLAMWYALSEAGAVARPASHTACSAAVEAWGKEQLAAHRLGPMDALRFATGEQLNHLVEAMKLWGQRVKANIY
ncbi:regulatory protein GemA [Polaromonas sp. UC242_47]|uniref:regulatory protein GemA n=1 Tax=Polaromonas sp. UC242_47 TaxID=3374626 RepID=UPI0037AA49A9